MRLASLFGLALLVAAAGYSLHVLRAPPVGPVPVVRSVADTAQPVLRSADTLLAPYAHLDPAPLTHDPAALDAWADSVLATLSVEEKIGQLLIVDLVEGQLRGIRTPEEAVRRYHVGGFLVPRLLEPGTIAEAAQTLQAQSRVPLFVAADFERGAGRYNNPLTELPSNMALGAAGERYLAELAGYLTAVESRALGINLLFAPVVDVNNNPANPIINIRSYGEDADLVAELGAAFVAGAERGGALTTLKHFPGHGNTDVDSHARMGTVDGDWPTLRDTELLPYRRILRADPAPAAVMTAHLWVKALDAEPRPATLSPPVIEGVLRDSLGFDGLVITDDIDMGALRQRYSSGEAAVQALEAGVDILLAPSDPRAVVRAVRAAYDDGRLTPERLDRSVRRILRAKAQLEASPSPSGAFAYLMEAPYGEPIAQRIAAAAITQVRSSTVLPLADTANIALIQLTNHPTAGSIETAMRQLADRLGAHAEVTNAAFREPPTSAETAATLAASAAADVVVLALHLRIRAGTGAIDLPTASRRLADRLADGPVPLVVVAFGNPYALAAFPKASGLLVAYDQTLASVGAVADVLTGPQEARGRLPITVDGTAE